MTKFWRRLFAVEIPLMTATILYAGAAPGRFLADAFGVDALSPGVHVLLLSYVSTIVTLAYLYARLLHAPDLDLGFFRRFQEALLVGDVGLVAGWSWGIAQTGSASTPAIAGIGMALLWGAVRSVYLWQSRPAALSAT